MHHLSMALGFRGQDRGASSISVARCALTNGATTPFTVVARKCQSRLGRVCPSSFAFFTDATPDRMSADRVVRDGSDRVRNEPQKARRSPRYETLLNGSGSTFAEVKRGPPIPTTITNSTERRKAIQSQSSRVC